MYRLKIAFFNLLWVIFSFTAYSQKYTISGYVREKNTGEELIGANIYVKELSKGTVTNQYGFYSLTLEKGTYVIIASFIGFQDFTKEIVLDKNISLTILLSQTAITTSEVVISEQKTDKNISSTEMGTVKLPIKEIQNLPAFMGEVDVMKTIQLLPGVQAAGEGNTGFYVRGGGPDQNLILLDEAVVYNAAHLFGFFSIFNSDIVKDINLVKGGMPANYGGRLSSVLDVSMKNGNEKHFAAEGGIGVIASRLTLQGPIIKDTAAFIISGRRTYIDLLINPFIKKTAKAKGSGYYFYDLNTKINYRFGNKDRLFFSGYFGRDVFSYKNKENKFNISIPWGNATTTLRWNHLFSDKLFVNTMLLFSDYQFEFAAEESDFEMKLTSGITDYNFKTDFNYFPNIHNKTKFGLNYCYHIFMPSTVSARIGETNYNTGDIIKQYANDVAIYINNEYDFTEFITINAGLRGTIFQQIGPFTRYVKNEFNRNSDTIKYERWENVKTYTRLEPRISLRYTINKQSSLKAAFTQNYQYLHLATVSSVSLPTDLWIPSSDKIKPQLGRLYSVGYFRNLKKNTYETSIELYFKDLQNQISFREGVSPGDDAGDNTDNYITTGKGTSYGVEFFIKKNYGDFTGWIGYTLSRTTRKFPEINEGKTYPAKYDRRHDVSVALNYKATKRLSFSSVFVYATGDATTLAIGRYVIEGGIVNQYGPMNSYRMPPYHRLDLSVTVEGKEYKKYQSSWNFSVYNVYNRHNPYFIYFATEGSIQAGSFKTKAFQVSLFPILPSVAWNFKF